jgi:hypothetical protein
VAGGAPELRESLGLARRLAVEAASLDDERGQFILGYHILEISRQPYDGLLVAPDRGKFFAVLVCERIKK